MVFVRVFVSLLFVVLCSEWNALAGGNSEENCSIHALRKMPRMVDSAEYLFEDDFEVRLNAVRALPQQENWLEYSPDVRKYFSEDERYAFLILSGLSLSRGEGDIATLERIGPDSFVYLLDSEFGRLFQVFHVGTAGNIHDVFWGKGDLLVVLGIGDGKGIIQCVDLSGWKLFTYLVDEEYLRNDGREEALIIKRLERVPDLVESVD